MKTTTKAQRKEIKRVKRLYKAATSNASKHVIMYDNEMKLSKADMQNSNLQGIDYKVFFIGSNRSIILQSGATLTGCKTTKANKASNTLQFIKR